MWLALKLLAAVVFYGAAIEPRLVHRVDQVAKIPNLPAAWEHRQIAVFTDIQIGMWWANTDAVRRIVGDVVQIRPAAVLLAGDFVYNADSISVEMQMADVLALLHPLLENGLPSYAVLGNHDYSLMNEHSDKENYIARRVRLKLDSAGIKMLDNRSIALVIPRSVAADSGAAIAPVDTAASAQLYLVGIGDKWAKNDRTEAAFGAVPAGAARIVFMHDPDSFVKIPAGQAPLAIAAHTHAMQLDVPWVSDWLWRRYFSNTGSGLAGWVTTHGQPGNRLYVNRGIGFSIVPVRINAVPELTIFTLERAK